MATGYAAKLILECTIFHGMLQDFCLPYMTVRTGLY